MDFFIKIIIAIGFMIGIFDTFLNNKFGLSQKFKQGFYMIGSMMLSMAGIMSFAPVLALLLKPLVMPICDAINIDPSILSILLSCDMGGYPLAMSLAKNKEIGLMMGLATASMFGGTITFSIPVGFALLDERSRKHYFKGLLIGLCCIPIGSICNGILLGIPFIPVLWNNIPIILLTLLMITGMKCQPEKMIWIMEKLAKIMERIGLIGIGIGALQYLSGLDIIPEFTPLMDSMKVVCQMGITLIGMLPIIELFIRLTQKYLDIIGMKIGLDGISTSGMIISLVTTVPVYPLMAQMSPRGVVINATWTVFCSSILGSQLGLIMGIDSSLLQPYFAGKLTAAFIAVIAAVLILNVEEKKEAQKTC